MGGSVRIGTGGLASKRIRQANPDRARRCRRHELLLRQRVDAPHARQAVRGIALVEQVADVRRNLEMFRRLVMQVQIDEAVARHLAVRVGIAFVAVRDLLADLAIVLGGACVIYSDSRSAVALAFDPVAFKQTKHILRAAEFLRDLVAREVVTLQHLPGRVMVADLLTKAVSRPVFLALLKLFDAYAEDGVMCPV